MKKIKRRKSKKKRYSRIFVLLISILILLLLFSFLLITIIKQTLNANQPVSVYSESISDDETAKTSAVVTTQTTTVKTKANLKDESYVRVIDYIPTIYVELKYATTDNITGQVIYDFTDAFLRYGTVKKLAQVQNELLASGYSLKIWDAYRPIEAQAKLWEAKPDANYISNPSKYTSHNFGNTVDVTIVATDGSYVDVPTGFDDFTDLADINFEDVTDPEAVEHAELLQNTMTKYGFKPYKKEWWHFQDTVSYTYDETFSPETYNNNN